METKETKKKKVLKGKVVSDSMDKTVVVLVSRFVKNQKYMKYVKFSQKHKAHDPENRFKVGDTVSIEETRPISKDKRHKVVY